MWLDICGKCSSNWVWDSINKHHYCRFIFSLSLKNPSLPSRGIASSPSSLWGFPIGKLPPKLACYGTEPGPYFLHHSSFSSYIRFTINVYSQCFFLHRCLSVYNTIATIVFPWLSLCFYGHTSPKVMTHHFVSLPTISALFYDIPSHSIDMVCAHTLIV